LGGWFTAIHSHGGAAKEKESMSFNLLPHIDSSNTEGIYMGRTYQYHPKTFFTCLQGKDLGGGAMKKFQCGIGWDQFVIYNTG